MRKPSHLVLKLAVMVLCAIVLAVWVLFRFPCPIRQFTGIPCPGCGMGRAWLAALRFDLPLAFQHHPLFWAVPVVSLFILFDFRLFSEKRRNGLVMCLLGAAAAVCYVLRLAAYFRGDLVI